MKNRLALILKELLHHLPYSAIGVAGALGILLGLEKMGWNSGLSLDYFHVTHPTHIFLSATVTTAMFWKYDRQVFKTLLVGLFGTLPICAASDVFMPYLGGLLMKTPVTFHLCLIEEPWLVYPACFVGIFSGIFLLKWVDRLTEFGHFSHVLVSALASLLYLVTFDISLWEGSVFWAFIITLLAVWIPCCLSDIVFPLVFAGNGTPHSPCCGHHPHGI